MHRLFARDWQGAPFVLFGTAHLAALAAVVLLNLWLLRFRSASEETRRLLDMLPSWPYYIAYIELIGLLTCLLLYLPFALKDWRTRQSAWTAF